MQSTQAAGADDAGARARFDADAPRGARWASMASRLLAMDAYGAILRGRSKNVPEECC